MERAITLEEDKEAAQLHTLRNSPGEKHRIVVTHKELGEYKFTGNLRAVHYRQYRGLPAALVLFGFAFHFDTDIRISGTHTPPYRPHLPAVSLTTSLARLL